MTEGSPTTFEGVKALHEAVISHSSWFDGKSHLTPAEEDALQWAKEFMERYERKHKQRRFSKGSSSVRES